MRFPSLLPLTLAILPTLLIFSTTSAASNPRSSSLSSSSSSSSSSPPPPSSACDGSPLPAIPPSVSTAKLTIPWGEPTVTFPNGTRCCDSLAQVRNGIDVINAQLVELLAQRAAYVKEATRFKATLDTVDVPARNVEVIEGAVNASRTTEPRLPATIARAVFEAIINASVPFARCFFGESAEGLVEEGEGRRAYGVRLAVRE